jgi:hypothetical protein
LSLHLNIMTISTANMKDKVKTILTMIGAVTALTGGVLATLNPDALAQLNNTISNTTVKHTILTSGTNATKEGTFIHHKTGSNNLNITGSIPLASMVTKALSLKIKTTLNEAILLAQKTVGSNSSAISGFIRPLNGYLTYDIHLINNSNNTLYRVIIDPGNGKILYNHAVQSLWVSHSMMFGKGKMGKSFGAFGEHDRNWSSHKPMNDNGGYFRGSSNLRMTTTNSNLLTNIKNVPVQF